MKTYKGKPEKQTTEAPSFDKAKNLVLISIKKYKTGLRKDVVKVPLKILTQIKKLKKADVEGFRKIMYPFTRVGKLNIDSQAEKQGLCSHARARQVCFNPAAIALGRKDLVVSYHKTPEKKIHKTIKKAAAKAKKK